MHLATAETSAYSQKLTSMPPPNYEELLRDNPPSYEEIELGILHGDFLNYDISRFVLLSAVEFSHRKSVCLIVFIEILVTFLYMYAIAIIKVDRSRHKVK